tara:strand:- start:955 stop:1221 length:267 start_codon:yes stop_codon:yes gene_type:complete
LPTLLWLDFFRNNVGIVLEALLINFQPIPQIGLLRSANPEKTDTEHGIKARKSFTSTGASAKSKAMPSLALTKQLLPANSMPYFQGNS